MILVRDGQPQTQPRNATQEGIALGILYEAKTRVLDVDLSTRLRDYGTQKALATPKDENQTYQVEFFPIFGSPINVI